MVQLVVRRCNLLPAANPCEVICESQASDLLGNEDMAVEAVHPFDPKCDREGFLLPVQRTIARRYPAACASSSVQK